MLAGIKRKFLGSGRIAGIEIFFLQDGSYRISLLQLSLKKSLITIDKKSAAHFNSIEELKLTADKNIPVSLIFNGKGILTKKVFQEKNEEDAALLSQVLPNAKAMDFYIQKKDSYVTVARREAIDEVLSRLKEIGLPVISLSIGPLAGLSIIPFMKHGGNNISFAGHEYMLENDHLKEYKYAATTEEKEITIGDENITSHQAMAYAAAFQEILSQDPVHVEDEHIKEGAQEYKYKNLLKYLTIIICSVFIAIITVNIFLSFYLDSKNKNLGSKQRGYQLMLNKLDSLGAQIKEKEIFLKESGWLEDSKISYFSDRIASTIPPSVKLTELAVNSFNDKASTSEKKLIFNNSIIIILGHCTTATELNPWMKEMKKFDWVKEVKVHTYAYNEKNKEGDFKIQIELR
ncbi:MAG TPA: hypothetical protein VNW99_11560 [Cytophagaceae bacterium]|nr:hypothetical protein [Cytophagaceae bacterium]